MYRIAIDIGGTFTDLIAAADDGRVHEAKVPSDREHPEAALAAGLAELASAGGYPDTRGLLLETRIVIQGTTVAINAVLQGKGVKTGLLCTRGFRDTLEIRLGYKEERYVFPYAPPPVLVPRRARLTVTERVDANGNVLVPLDESDVERAAAALRDEGVEAVAICFLWSFLHPEHEQRTEELLREHLPGVFVTTSADVLPRIREYNRTSTTVLNAYVGPIVARYVQRTEAILRDLGFEGRIRYVQSNGGLAESDEVTKRPVLLLVSGPAAAPAAGLQFASLAGRNFITIDMGGTSFDTCLVRDGLPDMRATTDLNGYRVATPLIDVHAIGAGGGSIASVHEGLLRVGPESAEAVPGPACYMRGGTSATVTDANVVVGLLNQRELLGGRFRIEADLARRAVDEHVAAPSALSLEDAAVGVIEVVSRNMSDAIREITVRRGHDPRDYALIVGGGAGGIHAAQLAQELGIRRVVVPRVASEFCAFGAVVADVRHDYTRSYVGATQDLDFASVAALFEELEVDGRGALAEEGIEDESIRFLRALDLRYKDQVWEVTIDVSAVDLRGDAGETRRVVENIFHERHQELYEFSQRGYPCELITLTLTAIGVSPALKYDAPNGREAGSEHGPVAHRLTHLSRGEPPVETPVYSGPALLAGQTLASPAIVEEPNTTILVPPGWRATFHGAEQAYVLEPEDAGE
jgi:N-methylhydantoinase A